MINEIFSTFDIEQLTNLSIVSSFLGLFFSIIGVMVSIYLIIEAKKISKLFLGKARLPELIKDLKSIYPEISDMMDSFENNKNEIFTKFLESKSLVENLEKKLTTDLEKRKCKEFRAMFLKGKLLFLKTKKTEMTLAESWEMLRELSALTTTLTEFEKDLKWS